MYQKEYDVDARCHRPRYSMFTNDKVRTTIAKKVTSSSDMKNFNINAIIGRRKSFVRYIRKVFAKTTFVETENTFLVFKLNSKTNV